MGIKAKRRARGRSRAIMIGVAMPAILAGCSTTYNVKHISQAALYQAGNPPGFYFALPRTNIALEFLVKETKYKYGRFYGGDEIINKIDDAKETFKDRLVWNRTHCAGDKNTVKPISVDNLVSDSEFESSEYALSTVSIQDLDMIYRVEVSASPFTTYKYALEWNDDGTLKTASTAIEDTRAAFAMKVTESLIKIPAAAFGSSGTPVTLAEKETYCADLGRLENVKADYLNKLTAAEKKREAIVDNALKAAEGAILTVALAEVDKEITALKKKSAATRANFEKTDASESYIVVGRYDPENYNTHSVAPAFTWRGYKPKFEPAKGKDDEVKRIPIKIGNPAATQEGTPLPDDLMASLQEISPSLSAAFSPGVKATATNETPPSADSVAGYPYRFPVSADIDIVRTEIVPVPDGAAVDTKPTVKVTSLASATVPIAQFGPLLSLPNTFPGSSGEVDVTYNNATGGLTKASIGGKAISDTSASGYVDAVGGYLDARRKGDQADAKKAEEDAKTEANAETQALEDKIKYLEALKKYEALEKERSGEE